MWPSCDLHATPTNDAHHVTVIAAICAASAAACIGYYLGRRASTTRPSWKKRTSRIALGRQAINLLAIITARRLQRILQLERMFLSKRGSRPSAPLELLRGSVVRLRSY